MIGSKIFKRLLLICILFFNSAILFSQALNGQYTIGGSSPSYATWKAAVEDLTSKGISGPVVFNVREGIYAEQIVIPPITGSSASNKITFQSESKDSTSVTLTFSSNPTNPSTLLIKGADHLIFKHLTFNATNSLNARTLTIENDANNLTFSNNQFWGVNGNTSTALALVYSNGSNDTLLFESNLFKNGSNGVMIDAPSAGSSGIEVKGNTFSNQYYRSVYLQYASSPVVTDNRIISENNYSGFEGMHFSYLRGAAKITNNKVSALRGIGMYFTQRSGPSGVYSLVANNSVSIGSTTNGDIGIYLYFTSYYSFYHNTVNIYSQSTSSYALYLYNGNNLSLLNNIFANTGTGLALFRNSSGAGIVSDYNNIYASGNNLAYWNEYVSSLDKYKSASFLDPNSISVNPIFTTSNDLHVSEVALYRKGIQVSEVTTDFDGDTRNLIAPCIGADEFTPPAVDAGIVAIKSPRVPFASGNQPVQVIIRNYGASVLTSATLQWSVNALSQTNVQWTGSLSPSDSAIVILGNYNFSPGLSYDIDAEVSSPNGGSDGNLLNNKIQVSNLLPGLLGTYTIGGSSPNFTTISEAVNALFIGGAAGPITFNVRPGTYQEQIRIENFAGSHCDNPVVFQSENGDSSSVIIRFGGSSSSNYVVSLNGVQGIQFRNMIFRATGTTYGNVFVIRGVTSCITVEGCEISNNIITTTSANARLVDIQGSTNSKIFWLGNLFKGGSEGIYVSGGTNSAGTIIRSNVFRDQYYMGIRMESSKYPKILSNEIKSTSKYSDYYGVYLYNCNDSLEVGRNRISGSVGTGFYLNSSSGSLGREGLISNNFVSVGGTGRSYGIDMSSSNYQRVYHNNVHVYSTHAENGRCFNYSSNSNTKVYNNVFSNSGGGYAVYSNNTNSLMDYNNLYSSAGKVGYYSGIRSTLLAWQSAGSWDAHSVSADPLFTSATDLHVNKAELDGAGLVLTEVKQDIDGENRQSPPDIGADEFTPSGRNAALIKILHPAKPFTAGNYPIEISFKNSGVSSIDSVRFGWSVSGVVQNDIVWNGSITTGQSQTVQLGEIVFSEKKRYDVAVWLKTVNGGKDIDVSDDSLQVKNLYASLSAGAYTIGGSNPDFVNFAEATTVLSEGGIQGPITFNVRPGTYQEQIRIENFAGSHCDNPVVFQSENGDSSSVIIRFGGSSSSNYVVSLNGVQGIQFRNMIFRATGTTYGNVFVIRGVTSCITVEGCEISNNIITTTSANARLVDMQGSTNSKIFWLGNLFKGGSEGIYVSGGTNSAGSLIRGNIFRDQYYMGIRMESSKYPKILSNEIKSTSKYSDYYGVYLYNCNDSLEVGRNRISGSVGTGFYLNSSSGSLGREGLISNNFISVGGTGRSYGIDMSSSNYQRVYHNNVHVYGTHSENGRCFNYNSNSSIKVYNNIFSNSGGGYAVYSNNANSLMDYNNLYSSAGKVGYYSGIRSTLSEWQSAGSWDVHSVSGNPMFTSITDLHVESVFLNAAGIPLPEVTIDIDGQNRDPKNPDIGADEIASVAADASIVKLMSPQKPFPAGENMIKVEVLNNSSQPLTSLMLSLKMNGNLVGSTLWTGSISSGEVSIITVDTVNFLKDNLNTLEVWCSDPNGEEDRDTGNDTIRVTDLYPGLGGTYTLGNESSDFESFGSAINAMERGGVYEAVTFLVRKGTYNGKIIIPEIKGASEERRIHFKPEISDSASVILADASNSSTSNYVIYLKGADYITFEGFVIRTTSLNYARAIFLGGISGYNIFKNNTIVGRSTTSNSSNYTLIYNEEGNRNNKYLDNFFINGSIGLYHTGKSESGTGAEEGTLVRGNVFTNQAYNAISLSYQKAPVIDKNIISTEVARTDYSAISFNYCSDNLICTKNKVSANNGNNALKIENCTTTSTKPAIVANNMLLLATASSSSNALLLSNSQWFQLFNNTVHIKSSNTGNASIYIQNGGNHRLVNNIFSNGGSGYGCYVATPSAVFESNYNNIFSTGPYMGYWSAPRADIASWRVASGKDAQSVSANPLYISENNLHARQRLLDGSAKPLPEVTDDIDGDLRSATNPDIGADEFTFTVLKDLAVKEIISPISACDLDTVGVVSAKIQNLSTSVLDSFVVAYELVGKGIVVQETFYEKLQLQEEKLIKFKTPLKFPYGISFNVKVFALQQDDIDRANDTASVTVVNYPDVSFLLTEDSTICKGKSIVLKVQGGTSRKWSTGSNSASITVTPDTTKTYYVEVWNEYSCVTKDSVKVTVLSPDLMPEVQPLSDVDFCTGKSALLKSNILQNIKWSTGETGGSIVVKNSGNYYIDYKYTSVCTVRSAPLKVTAYEIPKIVVDGYTSICEGDNTKLTAANATIHTWSTGETKKDIVVAPTVESLYKVSMSNPGCSKEDSITIKIVPSIPPDVVSGMLPNDNAIDMYLPVSFSWLPAENATEYNVYIWPEGTSRPVNPTIKRISGININYGNLTYGKTYNWQVVSETSCLSADGPIQKFTVRTLPNLVADSLRVLAAPFSGQTIGVSWKVSNIGVGATAVNGVWKDGIYLSVDNTKGESDILLGTVDNVSALLPGGSYINNAAVKLPDDAIGPYYILVISNYSGVEPETSTTDNMGFRKVDIALSPPPDVQVTEILPPGVNGYAFSGEKILLNYTVKNMGTGAVPVESWRDLIQWSVSEVHDPSNMQRVGYINHNKEFLLPGESTNKSIEVKLPENYAGTIYFYVTTDENDNIFEHLDEDNNRTRSQPLDVLLVPPPDLQVIGCDFSLPVFSSQTLFSVQYKTINDGGSATTKVKWRDSLFLSPVKKLTSQSIPVGVVTNGLSILNVDAIATINFSKKLKTFKEGKYFFIVKTDVHDLIYEGINEENNIYIHEDTVFFKNPDLIIADASVSDDKPETGDKVQVSWTVKNAGNFNLLAQPKVDEIYVSSKNILDNAAVKVGEHLWNTAIPNGASATFNSEITLPLKFISDNHFIHIATDVKDSIFESSESNNRFNVPINIKVAPWADLVPQAIVGLPKDMRAGIKFPVSFTVTNKGDAVASADVWVDKLYGSISKEWNPDKMVLIAEFPRYLPLAPGESYTVSKEVAFPMLGKFQIGLDSFAYIHTFLYVDSSNHVFEYNAKGNNLLKGDSVFVRCPPHTNFHLLDARSTVKDTVDEANAFTINWDVKNLGNSTTLWRYKLWYDGLYLSKDTIYDEGEDVFIYDWTINGPIGLEETYSNYQTFKIPYDHFGNYYLLQVVDHTDIIHDADNHGPTSPLHATAGRKSRVVRTASGQAKSIHIRRIQKPELEITSFKVPPSAIAGQPVKLEWTIKNNGDKAIVIPFTDNIVLAKSLSDRGTTLGTYTFGKELGVGESYTAVVDMFLPVTASGNFFIILNTDVTKQLYESAAGELNNTTYHNISVIQQTPSDLLISEIQFDDVSPVYVDQICAINYQAKNVGIYSAKGLRKDLVYLSTDKIFDSKDILISNQQMKDEILPYQEITKTVEAKIPGITPGKYYVIIIIDASNNILESNDDNNIAVSKLMLNIQIPQLVIGVPQEIVLENKKDIAYEIKVPQNYSGESLLITLETNAYPAANELYLSKGQMPSTSEADFTYLNANSANQMLLVEKLETGSYFLLVKGNVQGVSKQNVKLTAAILPFEIRSVDASQGGNTGNVTLNIEGAKFERNMTAKLIMGSRQIVATKLYYSNSTKVYATFNLKGAPLGVYDVVVQKATESATYSQGFTVVEGSYGNSTESGDGSNDGFSCSISYNKGVGNLLDQELDYPSAVRRNRTVEINIYFKNNGNVDMQIPSRFLLSVSGHPVSSTVEGLIDMKQDLFLEFKEKDGPPGILRPNAQGVIRAYTRSFSSGSVIELILEE